MTFLTRHSLNTITADGNDVTTVRNVYPAMFNSLQANSRWINERAGRIFAQTAPRSW
jgi:hypothetical protein